jgi:hypothetical protein
MDPERQDADSGPMSPQSSQDEINLPSRNDGDYADGDSSDPNVLLQTAEEPGPGTIKEFDRALAANQVAFEDVCSAYWSSLARFNRNREEREVSAGYYSDLSASFEEQHPGVRYVMCKTREMAFAYYTDPSEEDPSSAAPSMEMIYQSGQPGLFEIDKLVYNATRLQRRAIEYLHGDELWTSMDMIVDVLGSGLVLVDGLEKPSPGAPSAAPSQDNVDFLNGELAGAERYVGQAAQRSAQVQYFKGMLWSAAGIYLLGFVGVVALFLLPVVAQNHPTFGLLIGCVLAGCTGAVVSVMMRITRGTLTLDYTMKSMLLPVGVFRPLVGAVFAVAVYVLLSGGLIGAIDVPEDSTSALYFFLALAFIAGFSERFAQDMLSTTETDLAKSTRIEASNAPAASPRSPPQS